MSFELKPDAKPYHSQPCTMTCFHHDATIEKEVERLVKIGLLEPIQESTYAFLSLIIHSKPTEPRLPGTMQFLNDLCELKNE